jgi:hypothetical protein
MNQSFSIDDESLVSFFGIVAVRVCFLFLAFQFDFGLLQLVSQHFQVASQFVFGFELFGQENQIPGGVVQGYVRQI